MPFRYTIAFPPRGLLLALLAALYLLPGLLGHDPWKPEDAPTIGVAYAMLREGYWLVPHLAGDPWYAPPLYYWTSALASLPFGGLLPLHDAARLASGIFGALLLVTLGNAAEEIHGRGSRGTAILVTIGCLGLFVHIHEAQPALATLAAFSAVFWGVALLPRNNGQGMALSALAIAAGFLSGGLPGLFLTVSLPLLCLCLPDWRGTPCQTLLALALGFALAAIWPLALHITDPAYSKLWWSRQLGGFVPRLRNPALFMENLGSYLRILSWYAWPALPLALWSLWRNRVNWKKAGLLLPGLAFLLTLILLAVRFEARSAMLLPLLVPMVLLAVPAAGTLRRGAANGLDWFAMMTFTLAIALVWLGWVAMAFGIPPRIAANFARLEPGFSMPLDPLSAGLALLITLGWLWQIFSAPRSPLRGISHWAMGVTALWSISMALWLPALDYAKSYRPVVVELHKHLPFHDGGCVSSWGLGASQRASLHYFADIQTRRETPGKEPGCGLLLTQGGAQALQAPSEGTWKQLWEGRRAGDRDENFRLYQRISP